MPWKLPRPRFGLRTLLVVVLACAVGLAFWTSPGRWRTYRNQQARQRIDPYELAIAGDGNPRSVPPELVAILGDSRFKHWGGVRRAQQLSPDLVATCSGDGNVWIWNANYGRQIRIFAAVGLTAPSEKWIATCGENTPVQIWHLPTTRLIKSWQIGPVKGTVNQVEFSPDGNYLATVNGNGTAYILSLDGILVE
jgi:WD40 repeat protein